ncbi:hypothetical protein TKK_0011279 [Trichogramma kaykai]
MVAEISNKKPRKLRKSRGRRYPCPICGKGYATKSAMTSHAKYDCGKPPRFKCPYCGMMSKKKFNVQDHIRHIHPNKPISCQYQAKRQKSWSPEHGYKSQQKCLESATFNILTGKYHCPNCNNGYGRRDTMLGHYRYECGKAPRFKCPYCHLVSKKTSNIYQHIRCVHPNKVVTLVKLY